MSGGRGLKVGVYMQPELYQKFAEHARRAKISISQLCCRGAVREMAEATALPSQDRGQS